MDIHEAMNIVIKSGVIVYPVIDDGMFRVAVKSKDSVKKGSVKHTTKSINTAITKTWLFIAKNI